MGGSRSPRKQDAGIGVDLKIESRGDNVGHIAAWSAVVPAVKGLGQGVSHLLVPGGSRPPGRKTELWPGEWNADSRLQVEVGTRRWSTEGMGKVP